MEYFEELVAEVMDVGNTCPSKCCCNYVVGSVKYPPFPAAREFKSCTERGIHVCLNNDCYIHYYLDRVQIRKGLYNFLSVNAFQASILEACEDSPTVDELIDRILKKNQIENTEHNRSLIENLLTIFEKEGIISLQKEAIPFELAHFGEIGKTYPAWIILEVTSKCNIQCGFCYKSASFDGKAIDMADIDMIIKHFAGKCKNLVLTGGEALLHPQIEEIIEKTAEKFEVSLLTNGLLLSRVNSSLLQKLVHIQVALYGYSNESYEKNTGIKDGFDVLKASYRNIPQGSNTTLVITVSLNKANVSFIEEYIKAACALGAPEIHFGLLMPLGKGANIETQKIFLEKDEVNEASAIIDRLACEYRDKIMISELREAKEAVPIIKDELACQAGKTNIVINQDGLVRACNLMPEVVFGEYRLREYIEDVENGRNKCYAEDIQRFKSYLNENGCDFSDMKCTGFCELIE